MGSAVANISLLKRFLSGIAVIIALTAVGSTILGMLLIAGLYALYISLIHHGLDPAVAALTASGIALAVVIALATVAIMRWYQLRDMPRLFEGMEAPIIGRVGRLADAFIAGLLAERPRRR
jgi:hypothetical protein